MHYRLSELEVTPACCVTIADIGALETLGVKVATFGRLSYEERQGEYPRTQEVGEAACFHGRDGLRVPSARSGHPELVVLCNEAGRAAVEVVSDQGIVDWTNWRKRAGGL